MSKLISTLLGATIAALALTASAQTTSTTVAPAAQNAAPAAVATDKKAFPKARHHKHKKAKHKAKTTGTPAH